MSARSDVKSIFEKALGLPNPTDRAAYLDEACRGDAALRAEVEGLLEALDRAGGFLNRRPPGEAATGPFVASDASGLTRPEGPATGPFVLADPEGLPAPVDAQTSTFGSGLPPTDPYPGTDESVGALLAGKYKLIEVIGEGGMGSVFMAQQTEPVKRKVAVKVIKAGMDSRAVLARFEAERQALAMMDHPNIAKVLDAGASESGRPFFVMELVKGVPITKFCDGRKLTPRERLELFVPVCQAIQHAHQKGVIHRDIKPSNVLVAMYDDRPVPKVIDFGVAKAAGQALTDMTLNTGFGAVVGTPEYMSPEQASFNNLDIDTRSDVYSLGVLLYELLAGSPPFARKELEQAGLLEILRVIREQEPQRPSTRLSSAATLPSLAANRGTEPKRLTALVRGELDWIAMKALEKDRNRRYETANGFAADVQRYLTGEAVQAVPPSMGYRARKFLRKHRGPVTAAALVLLALVGGIIGTTVGLFQSEKAEQVARWERDRAEGERDEKEKALKEAEEQRKRAEYQAASIGIDLDMEGTPEPKIELLRLARRLSMIPERSPELKEFVIRRMLVLGQTIQPVVEDADRLSQDGHFVLRSVGNATVLREVDSPRQIAIWRDLVSFVAERRLILHPGKPGQPVELWDTAGHLVMSTQPINGYRYVVDVSPTGKRVFTLSNQYLRPAKATDGCLWDGSSGKKVVDIPIRGNNSMTLALFSPNDMHLLLVDDGEINILSAVNGRFIRSLGQFPNRVIQGRLAARIQDISFSPTGRYIAILEDDYTLHRWRVADGVEFTPEKSSWGNLRWYSDEVVGVENTGMGGTRTILANHKLDDVVVDRVQGHIALTKDWQFFDLANGRRILAPIDKKFPLEISTFTENNILVGSSGIFDLTINKFVVRNIDSTQMIRTANWLYLEGAGIGFPLGILPSPAAIINWANVVARGEIDQFGEFVPWDERKWEQHRRRLVNLISAGEPDAHFRPVIHDLQFWLRQEIKATQDNEPKLSLLDRLIVAEPTWENYAERASNRLHPKQHHLAIQDAFEATRLAGVLIDPFGQKPSQRPSWSIGLQPGLPREHYEIALRWEEARQTAGIEDNSKTIALLLYRLGRYSEALAVLRKEEEKGVPAQLVRAVLTGSTAATARLHGLCAFAHPENQTPQPKFWHAFRAMCLYKLGESTLVKLHLTAAEAQQMIEEKKPPNQRREIPLYREAVELITGKPPEMPASSKP